MYFAAYLAVALAFALAFAGLIKKAPWPFYLVALVLSALYAYCWYSGQLLKMPRFLIPGLRSCMLGFRRSDNPQGPPSLFRDPQCRSL